MDIALLLHQPVSLVAVGIALAGVALYGVAPRLPSLFPPAAIRLLGCWLVCTTVVMLWARFETWQLPALVGGACFALIVVIHLRQTLRRPSLHAGEEDDGGKGR